MSNLDEDMELHCIFPTTILRTNINRQLTKKELSSVNYHKSNVYQNKGNLTSLDSYVLEKDFPEIKKYIVRSLKNYVDNIVDPTNNVDFYITQSWLNFTEPRHYHHLHNHSNSIISGVFYIHADENVDRINFYKNSQEQIQLECNWNIYNSKTWWFPVKSGDLLLFPSSLSHEVEITTGDKTRISLAFNVFIKGEIGVERGLTKLNI